jgi:hypothetical protein
VLPSTREEFEKSISSRFRSFLRRRRKKLLDKGEVTTEHFQEGPGLSARLDEGFALEQGGWKGRAGTAIAQSEDTLLFYTQLAQYAERDGYLSLHFLKLDGKAVAFQYGLAYKDSYYLLKPAYDETVPEASPGQLLMEEVLKYCVDNGLTTYEFLGPAAMWKLKWTRQTTNHTWLFIFRKSAYGRLLCNYKVRWVPATKGLIMRWVGAERLASILPDDGSGQDR